MQIRKKKMKENKEKMWEKWDIFPQQRGKNFPSVGVQETIKI